MQALDKAKTRVTSYLNLQVCVERDSIVVALFVMYTETEHTLNTTQK